LSEAGTDDRVEPRPYQGSVLTKLAGQQTWFTEYHFSGERPRELTLSYQYAVSRQHARTRSQYQEMAVLENPVWGRNLVIDGFMMATEHDERTYHEMLAHVPLTMHPAPRDILIIGGGDGGLAREVLRHPSARQVDLVELDAQVVEICRRHLPSMGQAFDDPRLRCHFTDGAAFVHRTSARYDAILIDSTDPLGPGKVLYQAPFYADCQRRLNPGGLFAAQGLSPWLQQEEQDSMFAVLRQVFGNVRPFLTTVPTYMGGLWVFALAGDRDLDPEDFDRARADQLASGGQYYNADMHHAAFCLPTFLRRRLLSEN